MMRTIRIIFLGLLTLLILGLGAVLFYIQLNEKAITSRLLQQLNKGLKGELQVSSVDLIFFQTFPEVSLVLDSVLVTNWFHEQRDTVLKGESLAIYVNLYELFSGNYRAEKIRIANAMVQLRTDSNGESNYHIWNEMNSDSAKAENINLESIQLINIQFSYKDDKERIRVVSEIATGEFQIETTGGKVTIDSKTDLYLNKLSFPDQTIKNKKIGFEGRLVIEDGTYSFVKTHLSTQDGMAMISAKYYPGRDRLFDLSIFEGFISAQRLPEYVPEHERSLIETYKADGKIGFKGSVHGNLGRTENLDYELLFTAEDASFSLPGMETRFKDIEMTGNTSSESKNNRRVSRLVVDQASLLLGENKIGIKLAVENFSNPDIQVEFDGSSDVSALDEILNIQHMDTLSGHATFKLKMAGNHKEYLNLIEGKPCHLKMNGEIGLLNGFLQYAKSPYVFRNIQATVLVKEHLMEIQELKFKLHDSDLSLKGVAFAIDHSIPSLNNPMIVIADMKSDYLDLNSILEKSQSSTDTTYNLSFNRNLELEFTLAVNKLVFRRFAANNITGDFIVKHPSIKTQNLRFRTSDGDVKLRGSIQQVKDGGLVLECQSEINGINIQQLFYEFEDFGQTYLVSDNLRGKATASVDYSCIATNGFSIDMRSILAEGEIKIRNGELIGFLPLEVMSHYIEVRELRHVKFEDLSNKFSIKNETISLPEMNIRSSAIDVTGSGSHTFQNEIDYRLQVYLAEILSKKARKSKNFREENLYQDVKLGKPRWPIRITGTVENPVTNYYDINYVTKKVGTHIKQDVQTILGKDSVKTDHRKDDSGIEFDWEE